MRDMLDSMQQRQFDEVGKFVRTALEVSVYLAPKAYGLTAQELEEAGQRLGYYPGEIADAARDNGNTELEWASSRLLPEDTTRSFLGFFGDILDPPDFRNVDAFEFVWQELSSLAQRSSPLERLLYRIAQSDVVLANETTMTIQERGKRGHMRTFRTNRPIAYKFSPSRSGAPPLGGLGGRRSIRNCLASDNEGFSRSSSSWSPAL
jgi:hypothetical protein